MRQQSTQAKERLNSYRPAKQRRAVLESNPPRDSWIERRRNKNVSTFGEAKTSPNAKRQTFISEPEHALKNSSKTISTNFRDGHQQQKPLRKNYVSWYPFFRSKPKGGLSPVLEQPKPSLNSLELNRFYDHVFYSALSPDDSNYERF